MCDFDEINLDELDKEAARKYGFNEQDVELIFAETFGGARSLILKECQQSLDFEVIITVSFKSICAYVMEALSKLGVNSQSGNLSDYLPYISNYLQDCVDNLDDGAMLPLVLREHIHVQKHGDYARLQHHLDLIDYTVGFYTGGGEDPNFTTVTFAAIVEFAYDLCR